jgi:hypothetical protein
MLGQLLQVLLLPLLLLGPALPPPLLLLLQLLEGLMGLLLLQLLCLMQWRECYCQGHNQTPDQSYTQ